MFIRSMQDIESQPLGRGVLPAPDLIRGLLSAHTTRAIIPKACIYAASTVVVVEVILL